MPEAYRSTKVMLSLAANAAARAATAAERARLNLSPNASRFAELHAELVALTESEVGMRINDAAVPTAFRALIPEAVPADLGGTTEIPEGTPEVGSIPTEAEAVAAAAALDEVAEALPSGGVAEGDEMSAAAAMEASWSENLADGPAT